MDYLDEIIQNNEQNINELVDIATLLQNWDIDDDSPEY